ncbi:MAG: class I SAM-dependent methyltransferase [Nocardioides sp.]
MPFDAHAAYDRLNAADHDHRFYAALAQDLRARRVLDLGCGTGTLARLLVSGGHAVVGIDPDPDMLRVARTKPGAERVDWRLGHGDSADAAWADLAVMSGHVAQVFVEEEAWDEVLQQLRRALRVGGTLAFESRNPLARGWEGWTRAATSRTVPTDEGDVEVWHETVDVALPEVTYETLTRNLASGEETSHRDVLVFRDSDVLGESLLRAGYDVLSVFGDWTRAPLTDGSPEIITIARRR